jgi:hypothetical protein
VGLISIASLWTVPSASRLGGTDRSPIRDVFSPNESLRGESRSFHIFFGSPILLHDVAALVITTRYSRPGASVCSAFSMTSAYGMAPRCRR